MFTLNKKELSAYKKIPQDQLEDFFAFKRRGSKVPAKKGKGSYNRQKFKRGKDNEDSD